METKDKFIEIIVEGVLSDPDSENFCGLLRQTSKEVLLKRYCKQRSGLFDVVKEEIKKKWGTAAVEPIMIEILCKVYDAYEVKDYD